jgi:hypothetical protein
MDDATQLTYFYSTLAQTAGAIVGLIGAFLVSRIVPHIEKLNEGKQGIWETIHRALDANNVFRKSIEESVNLSKTNRESLRDQLAKGADVKEHLEWRIEYHTLLEQAQAVWRTLSGRVNSWDVSSYHSSIEPTVASLERKQQRTNESMQGRMLIDCLVSLKSQLDALDKLILPNWVKYGMLVLIWLLIFGVIWPMYGLWVMSYQRSQTPSSFLLWGFLIGIALLIGFFAWGFWKNRSYRSFCWEKQDLQVGKLLGQ